MGRGRLERGVGEGRGWGVEGPKPSFGVPPSCFPPGSEASSLYSSTVSLKKQIARRRGGGRRNVEGRDGGMAAGCREEEEERKRGSIVLNKSQSQMEMFEQETPSFVPQRPPASSGEVIGWMKLPVV